MTKNFNSKSIGYIVEARVSPNAIRRRSVTLFNVDYDAEWRPVELPDVWNGLRAQPHVWAEVTLAGLITYHAAMAAAHVIHCEALSKNFYSLEVRVVACQYTISVAVQPHDETPYTMVLQKEHHAP